MGNTLCQPGNGCETEHDELDGFVEQEHVDHRDVSITGGGILSGQGGDLTTSHVFTIEDADVDHNSLTNAHNLTSDISHLLIDDIGTNTHAQIDTHLALTDEHIDWTDATDDLVTTGSIACNIFIFFSVYFPSSRRMLPPCSFGLLGKP